MYFNSRPLISLWMNERLESSKPHAVKDLLSETGSGNGNQESSEKQLLRSPWWLTRWPLGYWKTSWQSTPWSTHSCIHSVGKAPQFANQLTDTVGNEQYFTMPPHSIWNMFYHINPVLYLPPYIPHGMESFYMESMWNGTIIEVTCREKCCRGRVWIQDLLI